MGKGYNKRLEMFYEKLNQSKVELFHPELTSTLLIDAIFYFNYVILTLKIKSFDFVLLSFFLHSIKKDIY